MRIVVLLLFLLLPFAALSLTRVEFVGLQRTSETVLKRRVRLAEWIHRPWSIASRTLLASRLRSLGVFSDIRIRVRKEQGTTVVTVAVREKWTLLPFPMFSTSGARTMYGAFVVERNVFGLLKTVYGGAMFSADGVSVLAGFIDPSLAGSRLSWDFFFRYGGDLYEDTTAAGVLFRRYQADLFSLRAGIGYRVSSIFKPALFAEYRAVSVRFWPDALLAPSSESRVWTGIRLLVDGRVHHDWFAEGLLVRLQGGPLWGGEGQEYSLEGRVHWNRAAGRRSRLGLFLAAAAADLPVAFYPRIGGKEGFRTLPQHTVVARQSAAVSLSWEYALLRFTRVTVTLQAFAEAGVYREDRSRPFYGPGAGIRLYLKRLALPAMGFDAGWNVEAGEFVASFAVGMQT